MPNVARCRSRIKVLFWDGSGLWLCVKRLEKGRFSWPAVEEGMARVNLRAEELTLLLGGIELERTRAKEWWRREGK
jgi:transposase